MSEVVNFPLSGTAYPGKPPPEDVGKMLRDLVTAYNRGEVRAFSVAYVDGSGDPVTAFCTGDARTAPLVCGSASIAADVLDHHRSGMRPINIG